MLHFPSFVMPLYLRVVCSFLLRLCMLHVHVQYINSIGRMFFSCAVILENSLAFIVLISCYATLHACNIACMQHCGAIHSILRCSYFDGQNSEYGKPSQFAPKGPVKMSISETCSDKDLVKCHKYWCYCRGLTVEKAIPC